MLSRVVRWRGPDGKYQERQFQQPPPNPYSSTVRCGWLPPKPTHEFWYRDDVLHRDPAYGPAERRWDSAGNLTLEVWYVRGKVHNINGPALREWNQDQCVTEKWYQNGILHCIGGPAVRMVTGDKYTKLWYINGVLHRENGPACVVTCSSTRDEVWYSHGLIHRTGGPAITRTSFDCKCERWYKRDKCHNLKGPSVVITRANRVRSVEYFVDGRQVTEDELACPREYTAAFFNLLPQPIAEEMIEVFRLEDEC